MDIKNITIYTRDKVKEFLKVYYFEKIRILRVILNIIVVLMTFYVLFKMNKSILDIITLVIIFIVLIEVNTSFIPYLNFKKILKKKDTIIGNTVSYVFKKDNFIFNKDNIISYDKLYKVIENNHNYYLYIDKNKCLIVDKNIMKDNDITFLTNKFKEGNYKYKEGK